MSKIKAGTTSTTAYQVEADTTGTLVLQTGASPTTAVTIGSDQSTTLAGTLNLASQNMTPYTGFKNRIINGAMMIDQRNAGAAWGTSINGYTVDRWACYTSTTGKLNGGQNYNSITSATGFPSYIGVQSQSAYSVGSSDYFVFQQRVEGNNIADLGWGTASASSVTLSFWVRSSLTGTFGGALNNSAQNRSYPFTYTISAANTWEQKSVTIAGDTSGTWLTTNGVGIILSLGLGVGSTYSASAGSWSAGNYTSATGATSVVGTNGATFYITGVQLEKGSTATSFDYRPYGTELALCQRYYFRYVTGAQGFSNFGLGYASSSTNAFIQIKTPVPLRVPATTIDLSAASTFSYNYGTSPTLAGNALGIDYVVLQLTGSGMANGYAVPLFGNNNTAAYVGASAEL